MGVHGQGCHRIKRSFSLEVVSFRNCGIWVDSRIFLDKQDGHTSILLHPILSQELQLTHPSFLQYGKVLEQFSIVLDLVVQLGSWWIECTFHVLVVNDVKSPNIFERCNTVEKRIHLKYYQKNILLNLFNLL